MAPALFLCAAALLFPRAAADLNFSAFSRDPLGRASHLRLVGGSDLNYYSTEFNELCPEVGAEPTAMPANITERFQYSQMREDPDSNSQTYTFLTDDYLDNPYAGRIVDSNYTEVIATKEFRPDDQQEPVPHSRPQLCHYALRLTPAERSLNTATWSRFKQLVAYGFETEFHFRMLHRTSECKSIGRDSPYCYKTGADGFAFVVQNDGRKAIGREVGGLGYAFPHNVAVEFDTFRNDEFGELSSNHVSVHAPEKIGLPNSGNHWQTQLAYTEDIPDLQEGTHVARITYSTRHFAWDGRGPRFEEELARPYLELHSSGRLGLLTVELDGQRVLAVPINLAMTVQADPTFTAKENTPLQPNVSAYDELGSSPGRAWVGFTASTAYFHYQAVDILSWSFKEEPACFGDGDGETLCGVREGTFGRSGCSPDGSDLCSLVLQNVARQPLIFSARLSYDKAYVAHVCENGRLEWDHLHPYFLGCSKTLRFPHEMQELWIGTLDGTRTLSVTSNEVLQKAPSLFRKRSLFRWCIAEHRTDPTRLQVAQCDCEYCVRLLGLGVYYAIHYQQRCAPRFGLNCQCLEASEVDHDMSQWTVQEPLTNLRLHVCRGCAYDSQCARTLKIAYCEAPYSPYVVGNPLAPTIFDNGFQNLARNDGKVLDGRVSGDTCNCEPDVHPYNGDRQGRSGTCTVKAKLNQGYYPDVAECAQLCRDAAKCEYFTHWDNDGECVIYSSCAWDLCDSARCLSSHTYRRAPLGPYTDLKGAIQEFTVFPLRTVQTTPEECFTCLHLYEEWHCKAQCGPESYVPYLHWPAGQLCSSCMFAGNRIHELTHQQLTTIKACVYEATRVSEDPWVVCDEVVRKASGGVSALDLFNGVVTHYLSECPGRAFAEIGAVCAPNLLVRTRLPHQILSRMSAIADNVWGPTLECLNSQCDLVPKVACYLRLAVFNFTKDFSDSSGTIDSNGYNGAGISTRGLSLKKGPEQWVVTETLPFPLENTTLEAWLTVSTVERITNLAVDQSATANTDWSLDYLSHFALDGDITTYWSSQLGEKGQTGHEAIWGMDLGLMQYAGGVRIYWREPASDFAVWVSDDNSTWRLLVNVEKNELQTTEFTDSYFHARYVRVTMTEALRTRPRGPGEFQPVYSILEFEVLQDDNLSRLRPTLSGNTWYRPGSLAIDSDLETWWASPPNSATAELLVDFGGSYEVLVARVYWRYLPQRFKFYLGRYPCSEGLPTIEVGSFTGALIEPVTEAVVWRTGRCLRVSVLETKEVYGEPLVAIREVGAYTDGANAAPASRVAVVWPREEDGAHLTPVERALDGDPETYWLMLPIDGTATLVLDLGTLVHVQTIEVRWASINGQGYWASDFSVGTGLSYSGIESKNVASNYLQLTRRFLVNEYIRFVRLQVTTIMGSNPGGQLALEDIIISAISDNLATNCNARVNVSTAWCTSDPGKYLCTTTTTTTTTSATTTTTTSTVSSTTTSTTSNTSTTVSVTHTNTTTTTSNTTTATTTSSSSTTSTTTQSTATKTTTTLPMNTTTWTSFTGTSSTTSSVSSTTSTTSTTNTNTTVTTTTSNTSTWTTTTTSLSTTTSLTTPTSTMTSTTASTMTASTSTVTTMSSTSTTVTVPDYTICDKLVVPKPCVPSTVVNGTFRPHGPWAAADGDFETWWGVFGVKDDDISILDFRFDDTKAVGLVGLRWRYPAAEVQVWCTTSVGGVPNLVGVVEENTLYNTPIAFSTGVRLCKIIQLYISAPLEELAGEKLIGLREVEIYDTTTSLALNKPARASDGTVADFAVDATTITRWLSLRNVITSITVDLGASHDIWGCRLLFPVSLIPKAFCVLVSNDNDEYEVAETRRDNTLPEVHFLMRFTARWLRVIFLETTQYVYAVRTFEVYGSPNLNLGSENEPPSSTTAWNHSGIEAVDGDGSTFWLSEPLASSASVLVDLLRIYFVAGGIRIRWKFPAEDFAIYVANSTSSEDDWLLIYSVQGNLHNLTEIGGPHEAQYIGPIGFFEAQYVELRMSRPSSLNGDGSFAIYDFDILFDSNLAHYKSISATHNIDSSRFSGHFSNDSNPLTYWMPEQGSDRSSITYDLLTDTFISGFDITWRRPPTQFYVESYNPLTLAWEFIARWIKADYERNVGTKQSWFQGFPSEKVRLRIEATQPSDDGKFCALREILFYKPTKAENLAEGRPVTASLEEIFGNRAIYANDGNERGTFWQPGEGVRQAWLIVTLDPLTQIPGQRPPGHDVGRVEIYWFWPPNDYFVEFLYDGHWETVLSRSGSTEDKTDFALRRLVNQVRVTISTESTDIGILELKVWGTDVLTPVEVEPVDRPWEAASHNMIDHNEQSYWMSPPMQDDMSVYLDLQRVYEAENVRIWFGLRAERVTLWISEDGVNEVEKQLTSTDTFGVLQMSERGHGFRVRYLRIFMRVGYKDEEENWGTSIRDIAVDIFRNVARSGTTFADSVWSYEPDWAVDGDLGTQWVSRFGQRTAHLIVDLGEPRNIAGLEWTFGYGARRFDVLYSLNGSSWSTAVSRLANEDLHVVVNSSLHFRGRYIMLDLFEPLTQEYAPDSWGDLNSVDTLFSVRELWAWEHTGGGGAFGIQSVDGMQFMTVTYGLRQPGEWVVSSERDFYTEDFVGANSGVFPDDLGNTIHLVATFETVGSISETQRLLEIKLYRNGIEYGEPYRRVESRERLSRFNETRLVFGVRSSAHVWPPADGGNPRDGVVHGHTHSPFFEGYLHNVTIIKNALSPAEVLGLYEVHAVGGEEKGCHCYDACPAASNRFFPGYPVPCSGQGVCRRFYNAVTFSPGSCDCNPGYSGHACQNHCSELSVHGCCEVDDDCPADVHCVQATKACSE